MMLLEREAELDLIADALAGARAGRGSVIVLSGPAGVGKSTLLGAVETDADVRRLAAHGGELERDLALGVAQQLLEPALGGEQPLDEAAPAVAALRGRVGDGDGDWSAILHGLYRLVATMAADGPLLLAVDDVQWADAASARFLAFLARRLPELPVVLLLAQRSGEPAVDPAAVRALAELPQVHERPLAGLSAPATAHVVRDLMGAAADDCFCAACHAASAGNPFVLRELVRVLLERGVAPDADGVAQVADAGPPRVARWVLGRLVRLAPDAIELARAVAVLGDDAELRRVARLAGLSMNRAEAALDRLVESELIGPARPLAFLHLASAGLPTPTSPRDSSSP